MRTRPRLFFARVMLLALAGLAACDRTPAAKPPARNAGDAFPRVVRGGDGADVTIPAPPRRIVPASARAIDFVAALVEPERVAALPEQAFEYTTLGKDQARYEHHPRFNTYGAEPILALSPDLVVCDPWQSADTRARLADANIPVLVVPDVVGFDDVAPALLLVARAIGAEDRARDVLADCDARLARLATRAAARPKLRALCYANFGSQGFSAGSGTTLDAMLTRAGLVNVVAEEGQRGHVNFTFEQLLALDPDVIVVSEPLHAPTGIAGDRGGASEQVLLTEPSLANLRAVKERRIVRLPAGLYATASQGVVAAAERLLDEVEALERRLQTPPEPDAHR